LALPLEELKALLLDAFLELILRGGAKISPDEGRRVPEPEAAEQQRTSGVVAVPSIGTPHKVKTSCNDTQEEH
jgi:hypothetical protein